MSKYAQEHSAENLDGPRQVIIMRAIPGSGKSTMARGLAEKAKANGLTAVVCSADDYFYELGGGTYAFDPSKIGEAHKFCFRKFVDAINAGVNLVIVDNTGLTAWEISPYKQYAETMGYDVSINEVAANPAEAFKRQQHGVPEFALQRMHQSFEKERIPPWWERKRFVPRMEEGKPIFEEEIPEPGPEQLELPFESKADKILYLAAGYARRAFES